MCCALHNIFHTELRLQQTERAQQELVTKDPPFLAKEAGLAYGETYPPQLARLTSRPLGCPQVWPRLHVCLLPQGGWGCQLSQLLALCCSGKCVHHQERVAIGECCSS